MKVEVSETRRRIFCLLLGSCLASGCSDGQPPTYPVTGQVVYSDGSTLPVGGYVLFQSTDASPPEKAIGYFATDGNFRLTNSAKDDGVVAGNYNVSVVPSEPENEGGLSGAELARAFHPIHQRFLNTKSSGLSFTVSAETSPHEFLLEVTKPGRRRR